MDKDPNQTPTPRRTVRFKPRKLKPATKVETRDEQNDGNAEIEALVRRMNENLSRREPKVERKSSAQVAFGPGGSSSSLKTYGRGSGKSSSTSAAIGDQSDTHMIDVTDGPTNATAKNSTNASAQKIKKSYKEPWDYEHSNYPTTLPWRKPYSGDPEILDEEEFGEAAAGVEYNENTINPAKDLGLLERSEKQKMFLVQLPPIPLLKQAMSIKGKEKIGTSTAQSKLNNTLKEMPSGYMGKMLVYKSGAVKLKLGEILFDVSPGSNCSFVQNVVAIDKAQKSLCDLGSISKKAVVTPDLDSFEL